MAKRLLFSVTQNDCRWDYARGSGKGGQKRNKTETAVRCTHLESGAVGQSDDTRSQHQNKRIAFRRMAESNKFKSWHKIETARRLGKQKQIDDNVDQQMKPWNLKTEVWQDKWVEIS